MPLLQYLDALKEIKTIPDSSINLSLKIMRKKISELSGQDQARLVALAEKYYSPQVRALVGLLFSSLNQHDWPTAKNWKIR